MTREHLEDALTDDALEELAHRMRNYSRLERRIPEARAVFLDELLKYIPVEQQPEPIGVEATPDQEPKPC